MRPDLGELIEGMKRTLAEEVLPAVDSPFAREQLGYTLVLCEHLAKRWSQAHLFAADEYTDLCETLTHAIEIGRNCKTLSADLTAALSAAVAALAADPGGTARPLDVLSATTRQLLGILTRLLDATAAGGADPETTRTLRDTLRGFATRQLARDEAWVSSVPIGWW